jgi:hypothetical protein
MNLGSLPGEPQRQATAFNFRASPGESRKAERGLAVERLNVSRDAASGVNFIASGGQRACRL